MKWQKNLPTKRLYLIVLIPQASKTCNVPESIWYSTLMTIALWICSEKVKRISRSITGLYLPNPFISVLDNFALSQQKSEYLRLTLEHFLKKALLVV